MQRVDFLIGFPFNDFLWNIPSNADVDVKVQPYIRQGAVYHRAVNKNQLKLYNSQCDYVLDIKFDDLHNTRASCIKSKVWRTFPHIYWRLESKVNIRPFMDFK